MLALLPAILLTTIIGFLCAIPGASVPKWEPLSYDFIGHMGMFCLLTIAWLWGLMRMGKTSLPVLVWTPFFCLLYGIALEAVQYSMRAGRAAEWSDVVADALGCGLGIILYLFWQSRR